MKRLNAEMVMMLLLFVFSALAQDGQKPPKVATVGPTEDCDFDDWVGSGQIGPIQQAIDSPENYDEIRVKGGSYNENLVINGRSITIKGDYRSCEDAANDIRTVLETEIRGEVGSNRATVYVTGVFDGPVVFDRFFIESGEFEPGHNGGGLFVDNATVDIIMNRMLIFGNEADRGGGVSLVGGAVNLIATNTLITSNEANEGGGIYCSGANSSIQYLMNENSDQAQQSSVISNNKALAGDGGGVLLENGCHFFSNIGGILNGDKSQLRSNRATGHGGGVAVKSGASAVIAGYELEPSAIPRPNLPASIIFNRADSDADGLGDGGAIYVSGNGSQAAVSHALIRQNHAANGGAFAVTDGAVLTVTRDFAKPCWETTDCNLLLNNDATATGGAVFVEGGGQVVINHTRLSEQQSELGALAMVIGTESSLQLQTSLISQNGGQSDWSNQHLLLVQNDAELRLQASTVVDNAVNLTTIQNTDAIWLVENSLFHDASDLYNGVGDAVASIQCALLDNTQGLSQGVGTDLLIGADPLFVDVANQNYHLSDTSPAIDACAGLGAPVTDIDGQTRPYDTTTVVDGAGIYDIGFDEFQNDLIFKSDFENAQQVF